MTSFYSPTVAPCYGRNPKTKEEAIALWEEGKDFLLCPDEYQTHFQYCSRRDGFGAVWIKYDSLKKRTLWCG